MRGTERSDGEPIHFDDDWHLDHIATRNGYLGPSHARCNLAAARGGPEPTDVTLEAGRPIPEA